MILTWCSKVLKIPFLHFCKHFCLLEKYTLNTAFFISFPFPFSFPFKHRFPFFPWGWTHIFSKRHFFLIRWLERFIKCVVYAICFPPVCFDCQNEWQSHKQSISQHQSGGLAWPIPALAFLWLVLSRSYHFSPLPHAVASRIDFVKWHCVTFADYFRNEAKLIRVIRFHGSLLKKQTYKQAECEGIAELMMN